MLRVATIIGARPQFIKASVVSNQFKLNNVDETLINTGQHYDINMSDLFFKELELPEPKYNLNVGSNSHAKQTGLMMEKLDSIVMKESFDIICVYGDTNSTLAGALVASKSNIPVVHIESGLRSYNRRMPEEINRVLTDHVSDILFCPSENARFNLVQEGIKKNVYNVGDVMFDIFKKNEKLFSTTNKYGDYCLLTLHRAENTTKLNLKLRLKQLSSLTTKIIFPLHPRTRKCLEEFEIQLPKNISAIDPVGWFELMGLVKNAKFVLTDSGGLQKEAFWQKKYCFTLRNETEWIETLNMKANQLVKPKEDINFIINENNINYNNPYGDGKASVKIVNTIKNRYIS